MQFYIYITGRTHFSKRAVSSSICNTGRSKCGRRRLCVAAIGDLFSGMTTSHMWVLELGGYSLLFLVQLLGLQPCYKPGYYTIKSLWSRL
uniref:Uncharacterized protein n=1 Tax=Ciona intestinalis TaxID=7719 RepID=F6WK44_CIOIN